MADRVVKVSLNAQVSDYVAGMTKASAATREVGSEAEKLAQKGEAIQSVGRAALAVGALAAVGVGLAVAKFAEFDKAMSSVQAATHESAANMGLLRNAALDFGASTAFTASEAASAIEELAKAGVTTADILGGGLKGSLDLAAAGELEVGAAAEIAATALTQFNLAGSDVPHIADLLAAGAGKAQGSVGDLSAALNQSGLVASQMGLSIEETTGALAAFASRGLLGSDAGTSFRQMLLRLANPTKEASELMQELGISAYDASGQFVGMESLAGQLRAELGGLTQAERDHNLAVIFGSDAIRAANVLYSESASGVAEWAAKVNDSGFAAETAAIRMDNLAGDLEKLGGAFDTALIKTGSAANDALRGLVQGVTGAVDAFGEAPQIVQTATLALGAAAAAIGLTGGAALIAVPKIAAFKVALETLGVSASKTQAVMTGLKGAMVGLAAVGVFAWAANTAGGFIDSAREAAGLKDTVDSLIDSLDELGTKGTVDKVAGNLSRNTDGGMFSDIIGGAENFLDTIADYNIALKLLGVEGQLTSSKMATLDQTMAQLVSSGDTEQAARLYEELASRTNGSSDALAKLDAMLPQYAESQAGAAEVTAESSTELETFTSTAETAEDAVTTFTDALRGLGDTQLSLNEANRAVEESLDAFQESIAANGATLDITTEAGRQNSAALDAIAQSYKSAAAATVEQTGVQADAIPVIAAGREAIVAAGIAAGLSADQANAYADELGLIPADVQTHIDLQSAAAMAAAREMARMIEEIPNSKTVYLYIQEQRSIANIPAGQTIAGANGMMQSYANGGFGGEGFYQGRAGSLYKFAEPETGWEAFISGRPGMEERNRGIALEAYERLGGKLPTVGMGGGMSLDGMSITGRLEIGGDGLGTIVDGRIRQYDKQSTRATQRGSTGF